MLKMTYDLSLPEFLWLLMFLFYKNVLSLETIANRRRVNKTESNSG